MKLRVLVAVSTAALILTACASAAAPEPQSPEPLQGTATELVEISPLTGRPLPDGRPSHPVFVVKIENTAAGAPQYGLDKADLVMEELVEGGLTRLAAFFYSKLPSKVGHVRSLRTSDIGIAGPAGGQIVASGGAGGAYRKVKKAGIRIFSEDAGAPGFSSDPRKSRPYNRMVDLKVLAKKAKASKIRGPYLPWTPEGAESAPAAAGSKRATSATVRFSGATSTSWRLKKNRWVRTNGHAQRGKDFKADTMIVLYCRVGDAGYRDPAGNPVPETVFEGSGKAMIFSGKDVTTATWLKPSLDEGLTFEAQDGSPITIDPGRVFLELVPKDGGAVTLG